MKIHLRDSKMTNSKNHSLPLTLEQIGEITRELDADSAVLYAYYYDKPERWDYRILDMVKFTGWSESKVKRIRTKLRQLGYIDWYNAGNNTTVVITGKKSVNEWAKDNAQG